MKIIYWNTFLTTDSQALFEHMMLMYQNYQGIDYFCINEATLELEEVFKKAHWQTFYISNTSDRGVLIASKHSLKNPRNYLLSSVIRKKEENQNHILIVEAVWKNQPLVIATTHLTYLRLKEVKRRSQERKVLTKVLPRNRTIFGGDLNTILLPLARWDIEKMNFKGRIKGKTWQWHLKNTWYKMPVKLQLDHVFTTLDIYHLVSATILPPQKFSDHYPILVEIK